DVALFRGDRGPVGRAAGAVRAVRTRSARAPIVRSIRQLLTIDATPSDQDLQCFSVIDRSEQIERIRSPKAGVAGSNPAGGTPRWLLACGHGTVPNPHRR